MQRHSMLVYEVLGTRHSMNIDTCIRGDLKYVGMTIRESQLRATHDRSHSTSDDLLDE